MKRQEICKQTGLTPKALRLYEEKGLITPKTQGLHNQVRSYSQEDLERLQMIATLRRAMFTISEIREMLENPASIQRIFPQYLQWLRQQNRQISSLLAASERVDLEHVDSLAALTAQIQKGARGLPIPPSDIHFHFRQLDAMETQRPDFTAEERLDQLLPGDAAYRSSVVAISRDKLDNTLALNSQLNDTRSMRSDGSRSVGEPEMRLKLWQRLIRWTVDILLLFLLYVVWQDAALFPAGFLLIPAALVRAGLAWKDRRTAVKQWVDSMGWQADFRGDRRRKWMMLAAAAALLTVIGIGSYALVEGLRPTEHTGGPATEGLDMITFFQEMPTRRFFRMEQIGGLNGQRVQYALSPDRVYFILEYGSAIYGVDGDYGHLQKIAEQVVKVDSEMYGKPEDQTSPQALIYRDGFLYFITWRNGLLFGEPNALMRFRCGGKLKPEKLLTGEFQALGLDSGGTVILYSRTDGQWQEAGRLIP